MVSKTLSVRSRECKIFDDFINAAETMTLKRVAEQKVVE